MLEKDFSKEEILERYLNTVFFGNNAYGIQAAAETYFGKTAKELSFVESSFLAGLVRSPSGFDPINEPERSRARWLQVIDRLMSEEYITEAEAEVLADSFALPSRVKSIPTRSNERTYYTEALRDYLLNKSTILGETQQERFNQLFRGGLRIHTTLDSTLQEIAERAHDVLPATGGRFENAIVSLDATSGAIRAMVGGSGFIANEREVNMALSPRQTGSSIKFLILAAAVQAGAQAGDIIDGVRGCRFENPGSEPPFFQINGGVAGSVTNLAQQTWSSVNCAFVRLSQIVGLNRMVDTVYRASESPYLYTGQPESDRAPVEPFLSFGTGANELSPLDMAAGIQTLSNEGVHHDPFYVEYIDDAAGNRTYTQSSEGKQVFDRDASLETIDILKGVLVSGTGRRYPLSNGREAFGKTGTQQDNTNAWFVGGTKQLATAVWVGDPDAYTPMIDIPEFRAEGVSKVQGGLFPKQIWTAFMDPAHAFLPLLDWDAPPTPERPDARLLLPGNECAVRVVGFEPGVAIPSEPSPSAPPTTLAEGEEATPVPATAPVPVQTTPGRAIVEAVNAGTTIAPDNLDPNAPLPSVAASASVGPC